MLDPNPATKKKKSYPQTNGLNDGELTIKAYGYRQIIGTYID